ncbi:hypothetical protein FHS61_000565 [Altererythrobacter atlanticus]|uniref:Alpha-L-arabinofuranosidase B, catalytic n=1 Tax=Croceibacterium atlanticum TaxID=1267766 RepID=A0A0F7KU43_9SPHN|nr:arabinofuranosidase catalytic domain-containing protein [Croceibacterium atlanticum]AKH42792.1 Alpha-L-arabinofuranosidase B, catalytic [Croceibacterium atlanticum]MBB5731572.1 hypothetical protein [Croceibacterium atlanticum]
MIGFNLGMAGCHRPRGGAPAPAPADPYLPALSAQPLGIFAVRAISGGYSGPLMRVRRVSDDAEMDLFATTGSAQPDWAALQDWAGASDISVTTLYDQSGNGNHAVQDIAGRQPMLVSAKARGGIQPITHNGSQWLSLPSGLSGNGRDVTAIAVQNRMSIGSAGGQNQAQWMLGAAWNTAGSLSFLSTIPQGLRLLTSSTFKDTGKLSRSQPEVIAVSSGSSEMAMYRDGLVSTHGLNNSGTFVGGLIGRGGASYNWWGDTFFHAVYDAALDDEELAGIRAALIPAFGIIPLEDTSLPLLISPGNSIVQGTGASYGQNNLWFTEELLTAPIHIVNCAVFGQTAATAYNSRSVYMNQFDADRPTCIMVVPEPTNDISSGATGVDCWNNYVKPFIDEAVAAGFKVLVPTIIKRSGFDSTQNGYKTDFNNLARAYCDEADIFLVDYAADDAALTLPDGTHPNSTSYAIMAGRQAAAVTAALAA